VQIPFHYKYKSNIIIIIFILLINFSFSNLSLSLLYANNICIIPEEKFIWNIDKINLVTMIKQISKLTCKNYIIPKAIKNFNKISIISHNPISLLHAESIFLHILEINGFTRIKKYNYYKIIKLNKSYNYAPILQINNIKNNLIKKSEDEIIILIYSPKHIPIESAYNLSKILLSNFGSVNFVDNNFLLLQDSLRNIKRITYALNTIDNIREKNKINIINLKHIKVEYIEKQINKLKSTNFFINKNISKKNKKSNNEIIFLNNKTNNLLFLGNKHILKKIKKIVNILDVPNTNDNKQIKIYRLYNSKAIDIANILLQLLKENKFINNKDKINSNINLIISIHEESNSIIVFAKNKEIELIKKIIIRLDSNRPQIHVEAEILDVSITTSNTSNWNFFSGFSYKSNNNIFNDFIFFIANSRGQQKIANSLLNKTTNMKKNKFFSKNYINKKAIKNNKFKNNFNKNIGNFSFRGPISNISNTLIPSINGILNANNTYSDINIIASPSLTTMDNQKAEILVGEKIPTIGTISHQSEGHQKKIFSIPQIKYEDVNLRLCIKPNIRKDNTVYIEIEQENNEIGENIPLFNNFTQRSIRTKSLKTIICATNKQTVIIGGLINEKSIKTEKKTPILGDIPIIGKLFKECNTIKRKSNLIIMITPTIIRNTNDFNKLYSRKIKERYFNKKNN